MPGLCCPRQEPLTDSLKGGTAGPSHSTLSQGSRRPAWGGLAGGTAGSSHSTLSQGSRRPAWGGLAGRQAGGPQHLGLSREPAGRSAWPPGENAISVWQWHSQDPHEPPAWEHRCPWAGPCSRWSQQGEGCFPQQHQRKHTRGPLSGQGGCTSGKAVLSDLKSPPQETDTARSAVKEAARQGRPCRQILKVLPKSGNCVR